MIVVYCVVILLDLTSDWSVLDINLQTPQNQVNDFYMVQHQDLIKKLKMMSDLAAAKLEEARQEYLEVRFPPSYKSAAHRDKSREWNVSKQKWNLSQLK